MNKIAATNIDADMINDSFSLLGGIKEDQISCFELGSGDFLSNLCLHDGGPGQTNAVFLGDIAGKS